MFDYCEDPEETLRLLQESQIPLQRRSAVEMYEACFPQKDFFDGLVKEERTETTDGFDIFRSAFTIIDFGEAFSRQIKEDSKNEQTNSTLFQHMMYEKTEQKIQEIYKELGLEQYAQDRNLIKSLSEDEQKEVAVKLCDHVAKHTRYNEKIADVTQGFNVTDGIAQQKSLYYVLCEGNGICHDFTIALGRLLDGVGFDCDYLCQRGSGMGHAAVLLNLGDGSYILDPTNESGPLTVGKKQTSTLYTPTTYCEMLVERGKAAGLVPGSLEINRFLLDKESIDEHLRSLESQEVSAVSTNAITKIEEDLKSLIENPSEENKKEKLDKSAMQNLIDSLFYHVTGGQRVAYPRNQFDYLNVYQHKLDNERLPSSAKRLNPLQQIWDEHFTNNALKNGQNELDRRDRGLFNEIHAEVSKAAEQLQRKNFRAYSIR